jgi:hypothetical protein
MDNFLPVMRTALAHIPSKEPSRVIPDPVSHPISESLVSPRLPDAVEDTSAESIHVAADESHPNHIDSVTMNADRFGTYRVYARKPLAQGPVLVEDSDRQPASNLGSSLTDVQTSGTPYYHPFSNPSAAAMMVAHHCGSVVQSVHHTTQLAHILGSLGSDLNPSDLGSFSAALENKKLDAVLASEAQNTFHLGDGWAESSVRIRLPLDKLKMQESDVVEFEIGGVFHRDIIDIITSVYQSDAVCSFNLIPFEQFWKPSEDAPPERIYGEVYGSQVMLDADAEIYKHCLENDSNPPELEAISVPLMLYSDSTHLANFGSASSWPVYMFFGSQSKYIRDMPSSFACHHLAYMPSVRHI